MKSQAQHRTSAGMPVREAPGHASEEHIRDMVSYLRERLQAIGDQGDCAYERAMGTKYRELLQELEARLDAHRECA